MKSFVMNWKLNYDSNVSMFSNNYYAQPCQSPEYVTLGNGTCCSWQITLSKPSGSHHLLQFLLKLLQKDGGKPMVTYATVRFEIVNFDDKCKTLCQTAVGKDLAPMMSSLTCVFRINFDATQGYVSRDSKRHVTIRCSLEIPSEEEEDTLSPTGSVSNPGTLPNVVLCLFRSAIAHGEIDDQFSDVTLRSRDERQFHVHACFLAKQSSIFKEILESPEFREEPSRTVVLPDVDGRTLLEVLRYVYTETVSDELIPLAPNILDAIERYQLPDKFKKYCLNSMAANLHIQNAIDTLLLADRRRLSELKKKVVEFVVENLHEIRRQQSWQDFIRDYPTIVDELFELITKNNHLHVNNINFIDT